MIDDILKIEVTFIHRELISKIIAFYELKVRPNSKDLVREFVSCDDNEKINFWIVIHRIKKINNSDEKYCASALVALHKPDEPIYSSKVSKALNFEESYEKDNYQFSVDKIRCFYFVCERDDVKAFKRNCIKAFNKKYNDYKEDVSDVKKIDFVLWAIGAEGEHTWIDYI